MNLDLVVLSCCCGGRDEVCEEKYSRDRVTEGSVLGFGIYYFYALTVVSISFS